MILAFCWPGACWSAARSDRQASLGLLMPGDFRYEIRSNAGAAELRQNWQCSAVGDLLRVLIGQSG